MEMTRDPVIHPMTFSHATLGTPDLSTLYGSVTPGHSTL